jgi:hypothetical protein
MSNALPIQKWLEVVRDEYLDGFVKDGGVSIKFAVPVREDLTPPLKDHFTRMAANLGYMVVNVDSGATRVHMPHEIFFRIAEQVDWRLLARRVILKLAEEAGYTVTGLSIDTPGPLLRSIGTANNSVSEEFVLRDLRPKLDRRVALNRSLARDFRVAMERLCISETGDTSESAEGLPIIHWITGLNRRVSSVRRYSIYNSISRTNARHFLESLLYWVRFAGYPGTVVLLDDSRVTLRRNPRDDRRFYSRSAAMDHYELLRELIDGTDRLQGLFMVVLANEDFLDDDRRGKGYVIYDALHSRIGDEIGDRSQANPLSTLVRLVGKPASEQSQ